MIQVNPKPVLHVAGETDPVARFEGQKRIIDTLRKINGCGEGRPWGEHCTLYPSLGGTPVVVYIHSGNHTYPAEAPPIIVKFFKEFGKRQEGAGDPRPPEFRPFASGMQAIDLSARSNTGGRNARVPMDISTVPLK